VGGSRARGTDSARARHPDRRHRIIGAQAVDPCNGMSSSDPKVDLVRPARSPWAYDTDGFFVDTVLG
jgi:hypothetical protein